MVKIIYKEIPGYEGLYKISKEGYIVALKRKRVDGRIYKQHFLKEQIICNTGYCQVGLYKNGKRRKWSVHKLVALTFVPNPKNLPEINHKDGNRRLNYFKNLEWCNRSYNVKDGYNRGRIVWNKGKKRT